MIPNTRAVIVIHELYSFLSIAMMMAMAAMATKDHVPQGQDTKQTQHFSFLRFVVSYVPVIRYGYRIKKCISEKQD